MYRDRMSHSSDHGTLYSRRTFHKLPRWTRSLAFSKSTKPMLIGFPCPFKYQKSWSDVPQLGWNPHCSSWICGELLVWAFLPADWCTLNRYPREDEEYDSPVIWTHHLVRFLKDGEPQFGTVPKLHVSLRPSTEASLWGALPLRSSMPVTVTSAIEMGPLWPSYPSWDAEWYSRTTLGVTKSPSPRPHQTQGHAQAFASATKAAATLFVCWYLSAESGVLQVSQDRKATVFSFTASLTTGVQQWVIGLRPGHEFNHFWVAVLNRVNLDSLSQTFTGM